MPWRSPAENISTAAPPTTTCCRAFFKRVRRLDGPVPGGRNWNRPGRHGNARWPPTSDGRLPSLAHFRIHPPRKVPQRRPGAEPPTHSLSSATIHRREPLLRIGGFRQELGSWSDTFAIRALGLQTGICYVPQPGTVWMRAPLGMSQTTLRDPLKTLKILRRAAALMRSPEFRAIFPADHVDRWERDSREAPALEPLQPSMEAYQTIQQSSREIGEKVGWPWRWVLGRSAARCRRATWPGIGCSAPSSAGTCGGWNERRTEIRNPNLEILKKCPAGTVHVLKLRFMISLGFRILSFVLPASRIDQKISGCAITVFSAIAAGHRVFVRPHGEIPFLPGGNGLRLPFFAVFQRDLFRGLFLDAVQRFDGDCRAVSIDQARRLAGQHGQRKAGFSETSVSASPAR